MRFFILFVFLLFTTFSIHGYITIEIEPDDLNRLSEILQTFINDQQLQTRSSTRIGINPMIKKTLCGVIQLIGITLSLVCANLITSKITETSIVNESGDMNITSMSSLFVPPKLCDNDFGCHNNRCWRTCEKAKNIEMETTWCFSSPMPIEHKFKECVHAEECSPCWE